MEAFIQEAIESLLPRDHPLKVETVTRRDHVDSLDLNAFESVKEKYGESKGERNTYLHR